MTQDQFLDRIEGIVNDISEGISTKAEAKNDILDLLLQVTGPLNNSTKHLELFMFRVKKMRDLQKEFFSGKRGTVLMERKKAEEAVDNELKRLTDNFKYTPKEPIKQAQ